MKHLRWDSHEHKTHARRRTPMNVHAWEKLSTAASNLCLQKILTRRQKRKLSLGSRNYRSRSRQDDPRILQMRYMDL